MPELQPDKNDSLTSADDDEMRDEYDLDALGPPVIGKYYEAYQAWKKRHVVVDPDVAKDFPDSQG